MLLLMAGCASAVQGQAVAGTTVAVDTSSRETSGSDEPGPTTELTTESDTSSVTEPPTSEVPIPPVDPTLPAPVTDQTSVNTVPNADPLSAPPFQGSTLADPADFPGLVTPVGFQSPSGNISCGFYDDGVACQISEYDFETPPRPDECGDTGWGFNFAVDVEGGFMFCAGDVEGGGPALAYGQQLAMGDFHCVSREEGVTCVDAVSGGGFTLARDAYDLF